MKKLLALLLCVMLFVAVIPTSAFADIPSTGWEDKAVSNTAIKEAEKSIKNMYTAIATDELVFGTAQSLHDLFDGLATSLFEGVDSMDFKFVPGDQSALPPLYRGKTVYHDDLVDNTRIYLKGVVGNAIADYISKRTDVFTSDSINGGVDPEKYLNVFVAAVNDAVGSEKAQSGLQAFVYDVYALKVKEARIEAAEDRLERRKDWGLDKYSEFGTSFTRLNQRIIYPGYPFGEYTINDPRNNNYTGAWDGNSSANMSTVTAILQGNTPLFPG